MGWDAASQGCLRVNDRVLVRAGFPRTIDRLSSAGYTVAPLRGDQIDLLDAGFSSCPCAGARPSDSCGRE